jgi:hypothetical protein
MCPVERMLTACPISRFVGGRPSVRIYATINSKMRACGSLNLLFIGLAPWSPVISPADAVSGDRRRIRAPEVDMELSFYSVAACLAICQYECSNFVLPLRNLAAWLARDVQEPRSSSGMSGVHM